MIFHVTFTILTVAVKICEGISANDNSTYDLTIDSSHDGQASNDVRQPTDNTTRAVPNAKGELVDKIRNNATLLQELEDQMEPNTSLPLAKSQYRPFGSHYSVAVPYFREDDDDDTQNKSDDLDPDVLDLADNYNQPNTGTNGDYILPQAHLVEAASLSPDFSQQIQRPPGANFEGGFGNQVVANPFFSAPVTVDTYGRPFLPANGQQVGSPQNLATTRIIISQNDVKKSTIEQINFYRGLHGVSPLGGNPDLDFSAQQWADRLAATGYSIESPVNMRLLYGQPAGETIAILPIDNCCSISEWHNAIRHYDFRNPHLSRKTAAFTQLVWRNTWHVGVGVAIAQDKSRIFIVARYFPSGNVLGQLLHVMVPPPVQR